MPLKLDKHGMLWAERDNEGFWTRYCSVNDHDWELWLGPLPPTQEGGEG